MEEIEDLANSPEKVGEVPVAVSPVGQVGALPEEKPVEQVAAQELETAKQSGDGAEVEVPELPLVDPQHPSQEDFEETERKLKEARDKLDRQDSA